MSDNLLRPINDTDLVEEADRSYALGRKHGQGEVQEKLDTLMAKVQRYFAIDPARDVEEWQFVRNELIALTRPETIEVSFRKGCPTCHSPKPQLHPTVQSEGECSICPDPFHGGVLDAVGRPVVEIGSWQCQHCHLTAMTTWRGVPDDAPACCGGEKMLPYRIQQPV